MPKKNLIKKLWFLAIWCLVTFATQLVVVKVVTERYGFKFNGRQFALFIALISVTFNLALIFLAGWVDRERLKKEHKRFMLSGFCGAGVVICGLLVLNFKDLNAMAANALYKGILIPIAFVVSLCYGLHLLKQDGGKAWNKAKAWPQIGAFLLAIAAVVTAVKGSGQSGFALFAHWFPPTVLLMYGLCYAPRMWCFKTQTGPQLTFFGGEHIFTFTVVVSIIGLVHIIPLGLLPESAQVIVQQMRFTKDLLRPEIMLLGLLAGVSFGLYAPASILILMYDQGQRATIAYGSIVHKTIGLAGTIVAAVVLVIFVPVWFTGQEAAWPNRTEIVSFFIFCGATLVPVLAEVAWFKNFSLQRKSSIQTA
jgi:hypothetical protein